MSSLAPIFILGMMFPLPLMYLLLRVSVSDAKYNTVLLFGLLTISGEVGALVWITLDYVLGGELGFLEIPHFLGFPLAILVIVIFDLFTTLPTMRKQM